MDNLKDRGWDSMREILDREMPQSLRQGGTSWWWPLTVLAVASILGGLFLLNNIYRPPSLLTNQAEIANNAPANSNIGQVFTSDATINTGDVSVDAMAGTEQLAPFVKDENNGEAQILHADESNLIDFGNPGNTKQKLYEVTNKPFLDAVDVEKSVLHQSYVPTGNITLQADKLPGSAQIYLAEVDNVNVHSEETTDKSNESSGKLTLPQRAPAEHNDDLPGQRDLLTTWHDLPTRVPNLISEINQQPNTINSAGVQKMRNRMAFHLTSGAFMAASRQYGGVFLVPEFRWRIHDYISLGAGVNARYRNTKSDFILTNALAESLFSDASGSTTSNEFLNLNDITAAAINRSSFDLGLQGGLLTHLGARLRLGADFGVRFNNVFNTMPVTQVVLQNGEKYSSESNTSGYFKGPTANVGMFIEYATGRHGAIQLGTSYQMGQRVQNKLPLEMCVGYSLRLF